MKKIFVLTVAFIAGFALTANAGSVAPGQMTKCTDAKSITFETAGSDQGNGDRGGANLSIWKSSNFTTIPV
ncbi:MAG: hypothetical protein HOK41_18120, partial [Nitrospina sp.]|nr:hypothetical protein [Nitrospina sp.]